MNDSELIGFLDPISDQKAKTVVISVLNGEQPPLEAVSHLLALWVPLEELQANEDARLLLLRQDNISVLDRIVIDLHNGTHSEEARRLAELNWILANRSPSVEIKAQCAISLAQVLADDPAAVDRRLELLEFSVPEILNWDRPNWMKGTTLCLLAQVRSETMTHTRRSQRAVLDACEEALAYEQYLGENWLGQIHYIAGNAYSEFEEDAVDLESSIQQFRLALQAFSPQTFPHAYGSVLNDLGNSYQELGRLRQDAQLVRQALECYEKAMPYRDERVLHERTLGNRERAEKLLSELETAHRQPSLADQAISIAPQAAEPEEPEYAEAKSLYRAGDRLFNRSQQETDQASLYRQAAANRYLKALKLIGKDAPPELRAELYHRLGALFVTSYEDDILWTGVCFVSATRRLAANKWRPINLSRVAYHQGRMLTTIGFPDHVEYLRPAAALLRATLPDLKEQGKPGEYEQAVGQLKLAETLLVAGDDPEAIHQVKEWGARLARERMTRELSGQPGNTLQGAYRTFFNLVCRLARPQVEDCLSNLEVDKVRIVGERGYDEFNHAERLIEVAAKHRDLGDLDGGRAAIRKAEEYARSARFSAPSVWCDLAKFYLSLPDRRQAERCVEQARELMGLAAGDHEAVLPGDKSRRWIPEGRLEEYWDEIREMASLVETAPAQPSFSVARTVELLVPRDEALCLRLESRIRSALESGRVKQLFTFR